MMLSVLRCLKAEGWKYRRTPFLYLHILVPLAGALLFGAYYQVCVWDAQVKVSVYLEALAIVFPFLTGILAGMTVQAEVQAGRFQVLLGVLPSRGAAYLGKLLLLVMGTAGSVILALGVFFVLYREIPVDICIKAGLLLVITAIPTYLLELLAGFCLGKGAAMGLGVLGSLLSALLLTGLGDSVWKFIPVSYGVRLMDYIVLKWSRPDVFPLVQAEFTEGILLCILWGCLLLFISLIWFHFWEGAKNSD